jgi:4-hydroxyacetophenone monooxygenase
MFVSSGGWRLDLESEVCVKVDMSGFVVGGVGVLEELLGASDEVIADAVAYADPMALRGLLFQLTGDEEVAGTGVKLVVGSGGLSLTAPAGDGDVALLRRKAVEFLVALRDTGAAPTGLGPEQRLDRSLVLAVGEELSDDELALYREELAVDPWARGLEWRQPPPAQRLERFSVLVIGAGMGGLCAAVQLKRAGIPFTVVEKNAGVGGTWFDNRYPGCRVDTPSRGYTHILGVDFPYPYPFCPWAENSKYSNWIADRFELRDDIVFESEVRQLTWDEQSSVWEAEVDGPDGSYSLRSNAVISAVGFLNRPSIPEIEGMAEFAGTSWHTAHWPEGADLRGKRVAVIGTGCSGYQLIPELALEAGHVVVFQRTPSWLREAPGYRAPSPPQVNWLDRNLPFYTNYLRFRATCLARSMAKLSEVDPEFDDPHALNEANKLARDACISFLERKLVDPQLVAKMTPPHPLWSARPVNVDPEYSVLDAFLRDNVTLVTDHVSRINKTGIETCDGTQHDLDAIVYATGFHATEYLFPMTITGRDGITTNELWRRDGSRAYTFSMLPGFPNFWMLYGPNTNSGLPPAGFHELVTLYAMLGIERLILEDKNAIEPTLEAYWRFNELVDERNARKIWSDPRSHSYWSAAKHGRSAVMCPFAPDEIWRFLRHPNFDTDLQIR